MTHPQATQTRRFCLMTTGRTGSTQLMNSLADSDEVRVPAKDIECSDNELTHPEALQKNLEQYAALCGPIKGQTELIETFYQHNRRYHYAGYKSMPTREENYDAFVSRKDIQFIVLTRSDIASTTASFYMAIRDGSWSRKGEPQPAHWHFDEKDDGQGIAGNLKYLATSHLLLERITDPIHLTYEDLCSPGYCNARLDDFFGRHIGLAAPRPPTSGADYVVNWDTFKAFVDRTYRECLDAIS
jgi:hypothetical protein